MNLLLGDLYSFTQLFFLICELICCFFLKMSFCIFLICIILSCFSYNNFTLFPLECLIYCYDLDHCIKMMAMYLVKNLWCYWTIVHNLNLIVSHLFFHHYFVVFILCFLNCVEKQLFLGCSCSYMIFVEFEPFHYEYFT